MQGQTIKIMPIIMMHGSDHVGGAMRHVQSTLRGAAAVHLFYRHTVLIFTDIQLMSRSGDPHDQWVTRLTYSCSYDLHPFHPTHPHTLDTN